MAKTVERKNMTQTDSKGKVTREAKKDFTSDPRNFQWWTLPKNSQAKANAIVQTIKFMVDHQGAYLEQLTVSTKLYGNNSAYNLTGTAFTRANSVNQNPQSQRMAFNVCASVIDTLTSMIAKNKVIPTFITEGGIWKMQRKADKLSKFVEGIFYQVKAHKKMVKQFRDGAVWGDGYLHPYLNEDDEICVERVLPHEMVHDRIEAVASGEVRQRHRVRYADRQLVIAEFPEHKEYLEQALPTDPADIGGASTAVDLITVTESIHLRSSKKSKDGQRVICVGDRVMEEEEWNKDYFPYCQTQYSQRLLGIDGQGICERLQNLQGELNRNMQVVQRSFWLGGSFKVLLENGSKVVSQHVNNEVGTIIHYTNTPPQYVTPPTIQPEIISYGIDGLIDKAYRQEGISQMSAAGTRPNAELSGRALREMNDNEQDRFMTIEQAFEDNALELARQCIELAKEAYGRNKKFKVQYPSTRFMETIDWADIQLEEDEYVLKAFPVSSLPDDPAGKLQTIQEYMQAGLISPRAGRRLMAMPDVEMSDNLANAAEDLLHKIIEDILDDGKYRAPEPYYDLTLAKQLSLEYYNYADLNNCPESRMKLLRKFMTAIDDMTGVNQQPPPAASPAVNPAGGTPQAQPMPPPQSPLIPNVQGVAS